MPYTVCRNNFASPNDSSRVLYRDYGSLAECIAHAVSVGSGHVQRCSCEERLTATEQALKDAQEKAMIAETQRLTEVVKSYYEGGETISARTEQIGEPLPIEIEKEIEKALTSLPKTLLTIIIVVVILTMVLK